MGLTWTWCWWSSCPVTDVWWTGSLPATPGEWKGPNPGLDTNVKQVFQHLVTALLAFWMSPRLNIFISWRTKNDVAFNFTENVKKRDQTLLSAALMSAVGPFSPLSEMSRLEMLGISAMQPSRIWEPPDRSWGRRRRKRYVKCNDNVGVMKYRWAG